jgi:hypothetical protein
MQTKRLAIFIIPSMLPLTLSSNHATNEFREISELRLIDWDFIPGYDLMRYFDRYIKSVKR